MPSSSSPRLARAFAAAACLALAACGGDTSSAVDLSQPDLTQPDLAQPDLAQPDLTQPDLTQPDLTQPDLTQPDLTQLDLYQPTCTDNAKNGLETDVDCGGGCLPCGDGKGCAGAPDCKSGVCTAGKCVAPTCDDKVKNGAETDVDCGGTCAGCADGKACARGKDCTSLVCTAGKCALPTCTDNAKNGSETDVDCGGGACVPCADGKACAKSADCTSQVCTGGKCAAPTCSDQVRNGAETDTDCGGGACVGCGENKACTQAADCTSRACTGGKCAAPACNDAIKNGNESDVDCGGTCPRCGDGKACASMVDCTSGTCSTGVCTAASSCKAIRQGNTLAGDGLYSIDPDGPGPGAPMQVWCDMTIDGGGWTLFFVDNDRTPFANIANNIFDNFEYRATNTPTPSLPGTAGFHPPTRGITFTELAVRYVNVPPASRACLTGAFYKAPATAIPGDKTLTEIGNGQKIIWDDDSDRTIVTWCTDEADEYDGVGVQSSFCAPYNWRQSWTTQSGGDTTNFCGGGGYNLANATQVHFLVR